MIRLLINVTRGTSELSEKSKTNKMSEMIGEMSKITEMS